VAKIYFEKYLAGHRSALPAGVRPLSLAHVGMNEFVQAYCASDHVGAERKSAEQAQNELQDLIRAAGDRFDPSQWLVASNLAGTIGVILPQRFSDRPHWGTLFNIAVTPAFRQLGWGRVLHAYGLERLRLIGVERYVGSTDVRNQPMRRVFESNGCHALGVRECYSDGQPVRWIEHRKHGLRPLSGKKERG
jgi:RimJ/RimL family protein N-acetyltransferase